MMSGDPSRSCPIGSKSTPVRADRAGSRGSLTLVGDEIMVPCLDGQVRRYVNLDAAASTSALESVADAVTEFLPWYSSVHRGAGLKSQVTTAAFEGARGAVAQFVGAHDDDVVIFVRNTTEAINVLSFSLDESTEIISTPIEHHANMLPWRRHALEVIPFTRSPAELVAEVRRALARGHGGVRLLAVTGASNVTGEVPPIAELANAAHEAGAEILVDAAQLAPHRAIDMRSLGIDYLALSGHKLYAPYGAGALIGPRRRLAGKAPMLRGGGAIRFVTLSDVLWHEAPARHEAGSPNTVGTIALGVACDELVSLDMNEIARRERALLRQLSAGLAKIPGIRELTMWSPGSCDRVGVATFVASGYSDHLLAAVLSAEHGIGVRSGCFCAHPLVSHLLQVDDAESERIRAEVAAGDESHVPGAVRASLSLTTSEEDVACLLTALKEIMSGGPRFKYAYQAHRGEYVPIGDTRSWPELRVRLQR